MTIQTTFLTTAFFIFLAFLPNATNAEDSNPDSVQLDERQLITYARIENASFHPATAVPSVSNLITRISFPLFLAIFLISTAFIGYSWRIRSASIAELSSRMEMED
jgi:hypothetical protein